MTADNHSHPPVRPDDARTTFPVPATDRDETERLFELFSEGKTVRAVAEEFGGKAAGLWAWLQRHNLMDRYYAARALAADSKAAEGEQVLEDAAKEGPELSSAQAQVAKARAGYKQWLSSRWDPSTFADNPQVEINMDLGQLHLAALQRYGHGPEAAPREIRPGFHTTDAEIIEDEGENDV